MHEGRDARRFALVAHGIRDAAAPLAPTGIPTVAVVEDATRIVQVAGAPSKVFVSWAHTAANWSDAQTASWAREVIEFTGKLRGFGLDAELDLFHTHETETDWTRFGPQQVEQSEFVILVMSQSWAERWSGKNNPTEGAGAVAEADALRGLFARHQADWQKKVLIALLPGKRSDIIPLDLARVNHYTVDPDDPTTFDNLLRSITSQPLYVKPDLGEVPVLPPAVAKSLNVKKSAGQTEEYSEYLALRQRIKRLQRAGKIDEPASDQLILLLGLLDAFG
jgi:hypothetical protein